MASEHNDPVGKLMLQIGRDAARCVDLERDVAELVEALDQALIALAVSGQTIPWMRALVAKHAKHKGGA